MKHENLKALVRRALAVSCIISLVSVDVLIVSATNVDKLEQETTALQDELTTLQNNLNSLSSQITDLTEQINTTNESIEKTELDLAAAKLNEEIQYDAMKKRIKFLYETGNPSMIDMICASESMAEFLNKAEFIQNITEYDRKLLTELEEARVVISEKENELIAEKESLQQMQAELSSQQQSLNAAIASTSGKLDETSQALQAARNAQAAANGTLNNSGSSSGTDSSTQSPSTNTSGGTSTTTPSTSTTSDVALFAGLLECEAGSSNYDSLLAVATVVMNRVESSKFPNTLYGVIYQKGQFSPTWNGKLKKVLAHGPASLCYTVAKDALNGKRLNSVSSCLYFNATWATNKNGVTVGGNVFW